MHVDALPFHDRAGGLRRGDRGARDLTVGRVRRIDREHPFDCPRVHEWLHVLWDGRLRLCCMDYHGEVPLPSLANISVSAYLSGEAHAALAARVRGESAIPEDFICERCTSPGG